RGPPIPYYTRLYASLRRRLGFTIFTTGALQNGAIGAVWGTEAGYVDGFGGGRQGELFLSLLSPILNEPHWPLHGGRIEHSRRLLAGAALLCRLAHQGPFELIVSVDLLLRQIVQALHLRRKLVAADGIEDD